MPASKGGSDLPGNLLASCSECNTKRGNRSASLTLKKKRIPRRILSSSVTAS
ncbi:HNH endonuclease [Ferviditalea candida]|uniref:HNH endonuclease n=1 Tax=Ferviditalea candida TaxID=3108399 RepID=A0ABU5ZPL9_9BACL|nr:HNH endonuclease [Paenibacillaceae bacterium T2]